jgi:hypothetical protein
MAARPSFDMSKMSTADKILVIGGFALFIDTFLPWQRVCISFQGIGACASASAWGGSASFLGVLTGILSILLVIWLALNLMGTNLQLGVPAPTVTSILVGGTVVFGILKLLFVLFNHPGIGAFIGLILIIAIAYAGYTKMQEPTATIPPPGPPPMA